MQRMTASDIAPTSSSIYQTDAAFKPPLQTNSESADSGGLKLLLSAAEMGISNISNSKAPVAVAVAVAHGRRSVMANTLRSASSHSIADSNRAHPYARPSLHSRHLPPPDLISTRTMSSMSSAMSDPNACLVSLPATANSSLMDQDPAPFLNSPQQANDEEAVALMGESQEYAASPVAGDDDELQNAPVHVRTHPNPQRLPNHVVVGGLQQSSIHLPAPVTQHIPQKRSLYRPAGPLLHRIPTGMIPGSMRLDSEAPLLPPPLIAGPDVPPPAVLPVSDPEKIQDAKDLAAFAAWVTLRLIGKRWSLLMEQKIITSGGGGPESGSGTPNMYPSVAGPPNFQMGNSFAAPGGAANAPGYSMFVNNIPASAYQTGSVVGSISHQAGSFAPSAPVPQDSGASIPAPVGRQLLPRYQASTQRIDSSLGYRDTRNDSVLTMNIAENSSAHASGSSYFQTQFSSVTTLPALTVTHEADERTNNIANQVSSFGLSAPANFDSPHSSPAMVKGAIKYDASPVQGSPLEMRSSLNTQSQNRVLPSLTDLIPPQAKLEARHASRQSSVTTFVNQAPPFSQKQQSLHVQSIQNSFQLQPTASQHYSPLHQPQQQSSPSYNPPHVAKHCLPPSYIAHYTSRLTRLATLTLLKTPTPPQTTLLALYLLRRLISTPKPLPTRVSTPTRMLLGCLIIADALFGGERGVPSRVWGAIAQVSGLKEGSGGGNSGGGGVGEESAKGGINSETEGSVDGLGLIAGIKRDVLTSLGFNLHGAVVGYDEWLSTLKDLLKEEDSSAESIAAAGGGAGAASSASGDMKKRTRRILEELTVGEGKLGMGWKW